MIKEIDFLTASRRTAEEIAAKQGDINIIKADRKAISAELDAKNSEIDAIQKEVDAQAAVVKKLNEKQRRRKKMRHESRKPHGRRRLLLQNKKDRPNARLQCCGVSSQHARKKHLVGHAHMPRQHLTLQCHICCRPFVTMGRLVAPRPTSARRCNSSPVLPRCT